MAMAVGLWDDGRGRTVWIAPRDGAPGALMVLAGVLGVALGFVHF